MQFTVKLLSFGTFIAAFILWTAGSYWFLKRLSLNPSFGKSALTHELAILANYVSLFIFIYLLSGFWSWPLFILTLAFAHVGMALFLISRAVLGSTDAKTYSQIRWAGGEFGLKHPAIIVGIAAIGALAGIIYPIAAGISYFSTPQSPELTVKILQYTLTFFFVGTLGVLPLQIAGVAAENISEDTRNRILMNQMGALIPHSLFLSLLLSTLTPDDGQTYSFAMPPFLPSVQVIAILLGYFVFSSLLPYLIGSRRAKRWRLDLVERRKALLTRALSILYVPAPLVMLPQLKLLRDDISRHIDSFRSSDIVVQLGQEIDRGAEVPPQLAALAGDYLACRDLDPRFNHFDWLLKFAGFIDDLVTDLQNKQPADVAVAAQGWAKFFENQKEQTAADQLAIKEEKSIGGSILAVVTPALTAVLGASGKVLWEVTSTSLFR